MSGNGYEPIGNGKSKKAAERIELDAVSGLRFFATLCLVSGRAIENLWMDSGTDGQFFNLTLCTGLHLLAKDVVSFYYILSGFTMTWGYISRDFDSHEVRWRYWVRRFARFYPDFAISSVVTFALKTTYMFGCHEFGLAKWIFSGTSLLLFSAWYRFIPGSGYVNGPVWFIVTLFWLWVFFPFLLEPVKNAFRTGGWGMFVAKVRTLGRKRILLGFSDPQYAATKFSVLTERMTLPYLEYGAFRSSILLLWVLSLVPWTFISEDNEGRVSISADPEIKDEKPPSSHN